MAQKEANALNGEDGQQEDENANTEENVDSGGADDAGGIKNEVDETNPGDEQTSNVTEQNTTRESPPLPIVIDDLAELGVEWMISKTEEGVGNWGKEYETSESLENIDDGQFDIEVPPPMPDVKLSSHGQTMHLVPMKDDRTSTTLTWIRKSALRKDSASDRRITIRGLCLGDLFHPRIYTLIQMAQSTDYSSTDRTTANSCSSGILTLNFRTILDRLVSLRRYLLDIEIPDRRLEIVCTFPDHKRPPDFETLWKAYELEGVPPCSSHRPDREILAKQIVVKNLPPDCDEAQIRKVFGGACDEIEFVEDYNNKRCAIVTFLDVVSCHIIHARQADVVFDHGVHPEVYLMTEMIVNSKLMPKKLKEETEEERNIRHTFELLWNHQQKVANAMHIQERFGGGRVGNDYLSRKTLQNVTRKLPSDVKQRVEIRARERKAQEAVEKEREKCAAQEALKEQLSVTKSEQEQKNGADDVPLEKTPSVEPAAATPVKRAADVAAVDQSLKRPRKKIFRGGSSGGAAGFGMQRRGMSAAGGGGYRRDQLVQQYQRGDSRGYMQAPRRGGPPPGASPPGRYGGGGGYPGEARASPWLVPPMPAASSFDRQMEASIGYGSPAGLMARREAPPPYEHGGGGSLFGGPGGAPYAGQGSAGYMGREMDMHRGGGGGSGELYQRRDALGPDFQRTDYRGFYGKR